jgi:hypothetical protein
MCSSTSTFDISICIDPTLENGSAGLVLYLLGGVWQNLLSSSTA